MGEGTILAEALKQSLWAALFIALLWWVLRTNEQREQRYLQIIKTLSDDLPDQMGRVIEDKLKALLNDRGGGKS